MDLYRELGVDRAASKGEIRRAYRRGAKKAHPDGGGSAEAFERLNMAQLILLDDKKRKHYDETGEVEDIAPDNTQARILEFASVAIDIALGNLANRGKEPHEADLLAEMRIIIRDMNHQLDQEISTYKKGVEKWGKVQGRFSVKDGPNYLETLVLGKITQLSHMIAQIAGKKESLSALTDMIKNYEYRVDRPKEGPTTISPYAGIKWIFPS